MEPDWVYHRPGWAELWDFRDECRGRFVAECLPFALAAGDSSPRAAPRLKHLAPPTGECFGQAACQIEIL
jgi:hypothetical protein